MAHDEIAVVKLLEARGLRVTRRRLSILDAICDAHGHVTVPEVVRRVKAEDPSIDQSTVYRTLEVFRELGVVAASATPTGERVYEIVGATPHHHLVCRTCGRKYDVDHTTMQPLFDELRRTHGFVVAATHLMLDGVCADCLARS